MQDVEPTAEEVNFADHGLPLTRRFRALKIWLSVKVLGLS
jgi:aromatic-L-amino-acid/L-tryptophan decarboxylase